LVENSLTKRKTQLTPKPMDMTVPVTDDALNV
jgi:hypothetical protein